MADDEHPVSSGRRVKFRQQRVEIVARQFRRCQPQRDRDRFGSLNRPPQVGREDLSNASILENDSKALCAGLSGSGQH